TGSPASWIEVDDADPPIGLQRLGRPLQQHHRIAWCDFHFAIRVDDERGIDAVGGQVRVGRRTEDRPHVPQVLTLYSPPDRLDHRRLNVFRVDDAVWSDACREAGGEPSSAGTKIGDD